MTNHRVFIAINLPNYIKAKFVKYQQQWQNLPLRLTKEFSLHLTLLFLGSLANEQMLSVCQLAKQVGQRHSGFELTFNNIALGPKFNNPRLIWAEGLASVALTNLKNDLEKTLLQSANILHLKSEVRFFKPHITLARIKTWQWQNMPNRVEIDESIDIKFSVESYEVMESQLLRSGAEYTVLESINLGK